MKILYVCHRIPYPLNKGDKIRAFYQVRHLARRHEVHLYCLADDPTDLEHVDFLRTFCRTVEVERLSPFMGRVRSLLGLLSSKPLTLNYFYSPTLQSKIQQAYTSEIFDVGVAYSSSMIPYFSAFPSPLVIDFVDLDSQKWLQYAKATKPPLCWIYAMEGRRLFQYELASSAKAPASIVVSEEEGRVLKERGAPKRLEAVPLGVDLEYYRSDTSPEPRFASMDRPILIFVGNMDYRPNFEAVLHFSTEILPGVASRIPDVLFLVVGANPPQSIRDLHDGQSIFVTGKVPDTRPYVSAGTLAVVPLFMARGIQTKVLEAMAMGLPVVLTEQTSKAIGALSGRDYESTRNAGEMKEAIIRLLTHPEQAKAMGQAGRKYVKEHFAWEGKLLRYEKILEETARVS
jgi:sugar transferase (PEP-CTERM/EpsH1 system associated)